MKWTVLISVLILNMTTDSRTVAQSYNYGNNSCRVIYQSSIGLANPSPTYIGSGTLSKSAQGIIQSGAQVNRELPKVNRGSYFGTPGDNMYSNAPIHSQDPQPIFIHSPAKIIYTQQSSKQTDYTYIPDPNIPLNYSNVGTEPSIQTNKYNISTYNVPPKNDQTSKRTVQNILSRDHY